MYEDDWLESRYEDINGGAYSDPEYDNTDLYGEVPWCEECDCEYSMCECFD